jgi:hypothetical protein
LEQTVPTDPDELHAWLRDGSYLDWEAESRVLPGEHGGGRRIFLHDATAVSLDDFAGTHVVGAAAVRELYEGDLETLRGWAALVKIDGSGGGDGWFFYETFDLDDPDHWSVAEPGASGCVSCHRAGSDFVQSTYPLQ